MGLALSHFKGGPVKKNTLYIGGGGWAADLGVVSLQEREVYKPFFAWTELMD